MGKVIGLLIIIGLIIVGCLDFIVTGEVGSIFSNLSKKGWDD